MPSPDDPTDNLATLTHARLRVAQRDYRAAERLLRAVLERDPDHAEARRLLETLAQRATAAADEQPGEEALEPPVAGDPARLARAFRDALGRGEAPPGGRIRRLESWLRKIRGGR